MAPKKKQAKKAAPRAAKSAVPAAVTDVLFRLETALTGGLDLLNMRLTQLERQVTTIESAVLPPAVPSELLEGKDRVQAGEVTVIPPAPVTQLVAGIRGIEEAVTLIAERMQTIVELQLAKPPTKPRGKKNAEPVAEGEGIKNNDVVDQGAPVEDPISSSALANAYPPGSEPVGDAARTSLRPGEEKLIKEYEREVAEETKQLEPAKETPKLTVVPAPAGETKAEEIPFETVRAKAVEYAQKHTKAKLKEVLATFVPGPDPKLSGITDRAAFLKALEA